MRLTLVRSALIALAVQGCLAMQPSHRVHTNEPLTVYIWNGEECIEAVRTEKQLERLENLFVMVRRNGEIEPFSLYGDNVSSTVVQDLWTQGGTIDLPNGEKLTFPPDTSSSQSEIMEAIRANVQKTRVISYEVTFSGPLPEITTAK